MGRGRGTGSAARGVPDGTHTPAGVHQPAGRALDNEAPPEFVELIAPPTVGLSECVIEWESARGKVTIHLKGPTMPDLSGLSRALWSRP